MNIIDGRDFHPLSKKNMDKVVSPGEFCFAVVGLVHGHVYGMIEGLIGAGADLCCVYEPNDCLFQKFHSTYPGVERVQSLDSILFSDRIDLVVNCLRPDERADFSISVLESGRDVFSDKPGFLKKIDGDRILAASALGKSNYYIYFSEHIHHEESLAAKNLIDSGKLGKVFHYSGFAPHRLNADSRPWWFFDAKVNGDVLIDLGCHLFEQFLWFTGSKTAHVEKSILRNVCHAQYDGFFDFGESLIVGDSGATGYIMVDWFTPDGLSSWGDCRAFISGTSGSLEVRKYLDIASGPNGILLLCDNEKEQKISVKDSIGFPFFGRLIQACLGVRPFDFDTSWCVNAMKLAIEASESARTSVS